MVAVVCFARGLGIAAVALRSFRYGVFISHRDRALIAFGFDHAQRALFATCLAGRLAT